jgi:hypothetical protein
MVQQPTMGARKQNETRPRDNDPDLLAEAEAGFAPPQVKQKKAIKASGSSPRQTSAKKTVAK